MKIAAASLALVASASAFAPTSMESVSLFEDVVQFGLMMDE